MDIDKNTADQTSYDADGSENSLEDNHVEKLLSNSNVHGSTDSLYFSTWTLDELATKAADSPQLYIPKSDKTADSYFVSGLGNSETSDTNDTSEEFQDCREPDAWVYQQFNPRLSWPSGLGDRLAAIWGEKGMQFPQVYELNYSSFVSVLLYIIIWLQLLSMKTFSFLYSFLIDSRHTSPSMHHRLSALMLCRIPKL